MSVGTPDGVNDAYGIPIRIKANVIDSVALAALIESLRCSWGINDAMPVQDGYKASVTTQKL
jgi:hypothetical protein